MNLPTFDCVFCSSEALSLFVGAYFRFLGRGELLLHSKNGLFDYHFLFDSSDETFLIYVSLDYPCLLFGWLALVFFFDPGFPDAVSGYHHFFFDDYYRHHDSILVLLHLNRL